MSRIKEIIESGQAPGIRTGAKDPQTPDVAIPRALRQLETEHSAQKIARDAGFTVNQLRETWCK